MKSFQLRCRPAAFVSIAFVFFSPFAQSAPGATSGDGGVTNTGAAAYSIPIRLPAGVNGMQPDLALSYHSRAESGLAGKGWNVSGISEIRRCGQFHALDGKQTGVALSSADRFCLNGARLVSTAGTYGANGSTYYKEIAEGGLITAYTSGGGGSLPGSGPQWFKVETPDGLIYEYGKTADSRLEPKGSTVPIVWAVNRVTDPYGNYIDFTYLEYTSLGAHYPREIKYTGTASASPVYSVYFAYASKPSAERATHYVAGASQRYDLRLAGIQLRHNDAEFRRYELTYEATASPSGISRLASVQECAGTDCLAATDISWRALASGISATDQAAVSTSLAGARPMDIDGDGRKDLVYSSGGDWYIEFAQAIPGQPIAFSSAINTGRTATNPASALQIEFNGDGRADLMYPGSDNEWRILKSNGAGFLSALNTNVALSYNNNSIWVIDVNGDGLDDVVYARDTIEWHESRFCEPGMTCGYNTGFVEVFYRLNTGTTFGSEVKAYQIDNATNRYVEFPSYWQYKSTSTTPDFNGDGIADLMMLVAPVPQPNCTNCDDPDLWNWRAANVRTGTFSAVAGVGSIPHTASPMILDFNGDGLSDLAYADTGVDKWLVHVSNGSGVNAAITTGLVRNAYTDKAVAVDYNADGRDDIVMPDAGYWKVALSTGVNFGTLASAGTSWQTEQFARVGDFDGDRDGDLLMLRPVSSSLYWRRARNHAAFGDLVESVRDGLGNEVAFSYGTSASPELHAPYSHATSSSYGRMHLAYSLVSEMQRSDGNGGLYSLTYQYLKGRRDNEGRGFLGFSETREYDSRDGRYRQTEYHTAFPFTGRTISDALRNSNAELLHYLEFTWDSLLTQASNQSQRILQLTKRERRYVNPAQKVHDYRTTYGNYDAWGNPRLVTIEHAEQALEFPSISVASTFNNSTSSRRCPGKLLSRTVTYSAPGASNIVENTNHVWDYSKCSVIAREREQGSATHHVRTDYGFDAFGNTTNITVSGSGIASRPSIVAYDALGYRPVDTTNAVGHVTTASWDPTMRIVLSSTDINGQVTTYEHDAFERVTRINRPDGSYVDIDLATYSSGSSELQQTVSYHDASGVENGRQTTYTDGFGRPRLMHRAVLGGLTSKRSVGYDEFGRLAWSSMPYFGSPAEPPTINYQYDEFGRQVRIDVPSEDGLSTRSTTYAYSQLSDVTDETRIAVTDPENNVTTTVVDTFGKALRVTDANAQTIHYGYDAAGRLVTTTDPGGNVVTVGYDVLGHRTSLTDPDLGSWTFQHNPLGELVTQTDAKNQVTTFAYDKLGRLIQRVEPDGTSNWVYDAATGAGKGRLHQVTGPDGYTETFAYDGLSRPLRKTLNFDASSYEYEFAFDAFSRLSRITYPESVATAEGARFAVEYGYDVAGVLTEARNGNNPSEVFWQATDMNAWGQYTTAILGNDITSIREFDAHTGRLKALRSFANGQPEHWNINYEYSPTGNVVARENTVAGLRETFTYDNLYRLDTYSLNGTLKQDVDYDPLGNIVSKTGVGSYTYGGPRPHAVTSTTTATGTTSYQYDANGNMTNHGTATIDWNSGNLPVAIDDGVNELSFHYGPNRNRYKQVAVLGSQTLTTHYIGGLMEAVGGNGIVQYRHNIVAAGRVVAQHTRDSNVAGGNPRTTYMQRDMLGSIGIMTDEAGSIVGQMHFDPWGSRLDAQDWDGVEQQADIDGLRSITHRGFTGHEQLDAVGLIHMNGRIYDPNMGRMLSADPINGEPGNLQRYNRYSYVDNRPLNFSDPTGYVKCREEVSGLVCETDPINAGEEQSGYGNHVDDMRRSILGIGENGGRAGGSRSSSGTSSASKEEAAQLDPVQIQGSADERRDAIREQQALQRAIDGFRRYMFAWSTASALVNAGFYSSILIVNRIIETGESTISTYELIGGDAEGYMLEPAGPDSAVAGSDQRIQQGTYDLSSVIRPNGSSALSVSNVPGRSNILIHIGNSPADTLGCFLPGTSYSTNRVNNSGNAFGPLHSQISGGRRSRIIITNSYGW